MIEPIRSRRGFPCAKVTCDECGREDVFPTTRIRNGGNAKDINKGHALRKAHAQGWVKVKGKLRCPTCEAKRKVVQMKVVEAKPKQAPREMTPKEKVQIYALLADVYDMDAGRYRKGDTDDVVAELIGVPPAWVAQIREADFGPGGSNDDIRTVEAALKKSSAALEKLGVDLSEAEKEVARIRSDMDEERQRLGWAVSTLGAIKLALSPRLLKKAGM